MGVFGWIRSLDSRRRHRSLEAGTRASLRGLMEQVVATREDEYDCGECYERLHEYAERIVAGEDPETIMPLVKLHLSLCGDCNEEFEALVAAIRKGTAR